ncbi:MAG: glycosyltransferase family 4 protein [Thermodesulfobacteriota bacterium]
MKKNPKILYFVTEDWYFCSHRLPLAQAARREGFQVVVATNVNHHAGPIVSSGLKLIPLPLSRRGRNPRAEMKLLRKLAAVLRRERPDLLHNVALKPVILGTWAAKRVGTPAVINALAGLGHLYTSDHLKTRIIRWGVARVFRFLFRDPRVRAILQNPDDVEIFARNAFLPRDRIRLIRGSGVSVQDFQSSPERPGEPMIILASRMIRDKGIAEFVQAAENLRANGVKARFILVGEPDQENPAAIPVRQLEAWHEAGTVEWWGHRTDMPAVMAQAHIVCLPSYYREGVPKVLLEGAASGRPIVAADAAGIREIVRPGENGLLVPARDVPGLAAALRQLIENPDLRRTLGRRGREIVEAEFTIEQVAAQTLDLYREILRASRQWPEN